jgi:hypothetical protein
MAVVPVRHPAAPFTVPVNGDIDQRLAAIATELNKKANAGIAGPAYHFLGLIAPDGGNWRVYVDNAGVLHTELVPR